MGKVIAYRCPFTEKLFSSEDRDKYIKHLKKLRVAQRFDRECGRVKNIFFDEVRKAQRNVESIEQLNEWLMEFMPKLIMFGMADGLIPSKNNIEVHSINLDVMYNEEIINSHSCPREGVTNWYQDKNKPLSYPGYKGRIEFEYSLSNVNDYFNTSLFKYVDIHTGSGGSSMASTFSHNGKIYTHRTSKKLLNHYRAGYEVSIFDLDWPGIGITKKLMS